MTDHELRRLAEAASEPKPWDEWHLVGPHRTYMLAACNAVPALLDRLAAYERRVQALREALPQCCKESAFTILQSALAADDAAANA